MRRSSKDKNMVTPVVLRILIFTMMVCGIIFAITGKVLILILFGEDFLPAYEPLLLLLPGMVFLSYCSLIRLDLLGQNMPGTISIISGMAVIVNIALNYAFVESLGMNGVALASTLSYAIAAIGLSIIYSRLTGLGFRETLVIKYSDIKLLLETFRRQ
jgi:O-antigen/teichoic acid export membrane protein